MKRIRLWHFLPVFALASWLAACSDSTTGPERPFVPTPVATSLQANSSNGQTALMGTAVSAPPAVLVKDGSGKGMSGVTVRFVVVQGGGSVAAASAVTDAQGIASAGVWTMGSAPGMNEVAAIVDQLAPVRFTATAVAPTPPPPPVSNGAYTITTRFLAGASTRQQQAVMNALNRWQTVITTDLMSIPVNVPAATCFSTQPAINEVVDDILIFVELVDIDGVGKTLGEAGPCYIRSDNSLPIVGHLKLDATDLQQMEALGTLDDVVLHEIGHVLGIGTLWPTKSLLNGAGTIDPQFNGGSATAAYRAMGGLDAGVPVENSGDPGTREGHWRETVFGNELMTGWISGSNNPLSKLTIGSLQDLGYGANSGAASTFQLGGATGRVSASVNIEKHERVLKPLYRVDRSGRRTRMPTPYGRLGKASDTP